MAQWFLSRILKFETTTKMNNGSNMTTKAFSTAWLSCLGLLVYLFLKALKLFCLPIFWLRISDEGYSMSCGLNYIYLHFYLIIFVFVFLDLFWKFIKKKITVYYWLDLTHQIHNQYRFLVHMYQLFNLIIIKGLFPTTS